MHLKSSWWGLPATSTWSWDSQPLPVHWELGKLLGYVVFTRVCTTSPISTPLKPLLTRNRLPEARFPCDSQPWVVLCFPKLSGGACDGEVEVKWAQGCVLGSGTTSRDGALQEILLETIAQHRAGQREAANQGTSLPNIFSFLAPISCPQALLFAMYWRKKYSLPPLPTPPKLETAQSM